MSVGITQVGPYDVSSELNTAYAGPGIGVTDKLKLELQALAQRWNIGLFDLNELTAHSGSGDPHLLGVAGDIDAINGQLLRYGEATPQEVQFAVDALQDPDVRIGSYKELIAAIGTADPRDADRLKIDTGTGAHIHLQVGSAPGDPFPIDSESFDPLNLGANLTKAQMQQQTASIDAGFKHVATDPLGVNAWWATASTQIGDWVSRLAMGALFVALVAGGFVVMAGADNVEKAAAVAA